MTAGATGADRRSTAPLAQLSRQLDPACVAAVHPMELAAILEAEGLTDRVVRERYGQDSVFACAQELYHMVPHRARPPAAPLAGPQSPSWQNLLRGVIYLLPALWTPHALAVTGGGVYHGAGLGLLVATLFGWGWMQGLAFLGYVALGENRAFAQRRLRALGLGAAALSVLVAAALAALLGQDPLPVVLATGGISLYLAAATTLLVLGRELALLLAALPALAWIAVQSRWPGTLPGGPDALLLLAVAVPALLAALVPRGAPAPARRAGVPWGAAVPHMLYGWLCAACMSLALLDPFGTVPGGGLLSASWSVAPLILSLGVMELQLRHLHAGLRRQSRLSGTLRSIVWRAAGQVGQRGGQYTLGLAAAYGLVALLGPRVGAAPLPDALLVGHVLTGLALMLSGLLINFALLSRVLTVWVVSLGAQLTLVLRGTDAAGAYAQGSAVAAVLLLALAALAVRDVRHLG